VSDPVVVIGRSSKPCRCTLPHVPVTTASKNCLVFTTTQFQLSESYEGILWIYGHHDERSVDGQALLAAFKLWRSALDRL
jgi:hypothetical protein